MGKYQHSQDRKTVDIVIEVLFHPNQDPEVVFPDFDDNTANVIFGPESSQQTVVENTKTIETPNKPL